MYTARLLLSHTAQMSARVLSFSERRKSSPSFGTLPPAFRRSSDSTPPTATASPTRSPAWTPSRNNSGDTSLGSKLQRLGLIDPANLGLVETIADELLEAQDPNDDRLLAGRATLSTYGGAVMKRPAADTDRTWSETEPAQQWTPRGGGGSATPLQNPRTPAVPATLEINLEEYYAAAALIGVLSAQGAQPAIDWIKKITHDMGAAMAEEARLRRKLRK
jgi:hypothetical protein